MEKRLQVILTNKEPSNEHVLWLNTNDNLLYRYSADAWTPINKIKFPTAEIYDPNKEYEEYSLVQFEGSSYIALKYVPINKYPSNSYYWLLFAKKGEQGLQGNSGYQGNIDELEIVNNLTQGGETAALSAEQGKLLNEKKVDKEKGKQLSTEDFTTLLKNKLEGLNNYNDRELRSIISTIENRLNVLIDTSTSEAIDNFKEIVAFLENIEDSTTLESVLINIENQISAVDNKKVNKVENSRLITEEEVEKFNDKAEKEGVYPNFVSGWSSNLTGRGDATERMFVYAPTGGDLSIGDGVAKIKAIKGNSIVEDGSIKSLNVSALKTTGFNQWDEQWELGTIKQATGELLDTTVNIRSSNPINVFPNTIYNVYFPKATNVLMDVFFYDIENTFIKRLYVNSTTFTTPENCFSIKFTMATAYGKVYKNDICINLSHTGYRNGEYEPYEEHTLRLGELSKYMPLRAIPGVYDEINANEAIKRIGVVKLKDLTWTSPTSDLLLNSIFNARISDMKPRGESENETTYRKSILCSKYGIASNTSMGDSLTDKSIFRQGSAYGIVIRDTAYTTIADFVASLTDDDVVYYELTEPNEEVFAEAINLNYLANDFGTEEAIVTVDSAPFRADVIYQFNAQDRIRKNSDDINDLINRINILEAQQTMLTN